MGCKDNTRVTLAFGVMLLRVRKSHVLQAEAAIEGEVARRLELCGAEFKHWPRAAQDEVARLEKKLDAAQGLNGTLHAELDTAAQQRQTEAVARAQLQV